MTAYERGTSGKAYLRFSAHGLRKEMALDIDIYNADGQVSADAVTRINAAQKQVLGDLLAGVTPREPSGERRDRATPTLDEAYRHFLGPKGPTGNFSMQHRRRHESTYRLMLQHFGVHRRVSSLEVDDLRGYATERRASMTAAPGRKVTGGYRQAAIEIGCVLAVLNWLVEECGMKELRIPRPRKLLKDLKEAQQPNRPRYTAQEFAALQAGAPGTDPRLRLLIAIQAAQRAGQLLRCMRSDVQVEQSDSGEPRVSISVPGCGKKSGGDLLLKGDGRSVFLYAIERGYLSDLEATFQRDRVDYPLFLGRRLPIAPHDVVPAGVYRPMDRTFAGKLLRSLEKRCGVIHLPNRGFHGLRRQAVDHLVASGASPAEIQAAGNWASSQIPMDLYRGGTTHRDRERAADLLSQRPTSAIDRQTSTEMSTANTQEADTNNLTNP